MIIAKFGGTSVRTSQQVLTICNIIGGEINRNPVVVVSALSGVTDLLLSLANLPKTKARQTTQEIRNLHKDLIEGLFDDKQLQNQVLQFIDNQINEVSKLIKQKKSSKRFLDKVVSFGEIMSSYIITCALSSQGIKAKQIIATKLIITDNNFGSADFLLSSTKRNVQKILNPLIKKGIVPVVTGFIGSTIKGEVTTLGRGGSDYTASIIGFCLEASEIQIWTDVDGMFSADPKLLKNAKRLETVSFREASELATFGARVLHPRTIKPAIKANIPVKILNTFNPKSPGTLIKEKINIPPSLRAISFKKKITLVNIYSSEMLLQKGFLAKVFQVFASNNISIDLVSVSEVSLSISLDNNGGLSNAVKQLSVFAGVSIIENLGIVSLIGEGVTSSTHAIKKIFDILDKEKILVRMVSLGATNINISLVIESEKIERVVKILHNRLLLKQTHYNLQNSAKIVS